mmetsp:Transcript_92010/g.295932  ORF Transcript_92010/g.295932 Transcript_92010/m.295932 type:complete len:238 (+) Transcript_92010:319-1032(+)
MSVERRLMLPPPPRCQSAVLARWLASQNLSSQASTAIIGQAGAELLLVLGGLRPLYLAELRAVPEAREAEVAQRLVVLLAFLQRVQHPLALALEQAAKWRLGVAPPDEIGHRLQVQEVHRHAQVVGQVDDRVRTPARDVQQVARAKLRLVGEALEDAPVLRAVRAPGIEVEDVVSGFGGASVLQQRFVVGREDAHALQRPTSRATNDGDPERKIVGVYMEACLGAFRPEQHRRPPQA